jgi:hypothetical protein
LVVLVQGAPGTLFGLGRASVPPPGMADNPDGFCPPVPEDRAGESNLVRLAGK